MADGSNMVRAAQHYQSQYTANAARAKALLEEHGVPETFRTPDNLVQDTVVAWSGKKDLGMGTVIDGSEFGSQLLQLMPTIAEQYKRDYDEREVTQNLDTSASDPYDGQPIDELIAATKEHGYEPAAVRAALEAAKAGSTSRRDLHAMIESARVQEPAGRGL